MPELIIFPRRQRLLGPSLEEGGLLLDAVIEESVQRSFEMTSFPIELGADITDHVIRKPRVYTMTGAVSDHPLYWPTDYFNTRGSTRHLSAWSILEDLADRREPFNVKGGFLDMPDMVIIDLVPRKTADTGDSLIFDAVLQEALIVETRQVTITQDMVDAGDTGEGSIPEDHRGTTAGEEITNPTLLNELFDLGTRFLDFIGD